MNFAVSRFRRLLPVACATLVMTNLCDLADSIIAGRILGEVALGAIELVWPLLELVFFFGMTVANGTAMRYVEAVGAFDSRRASAVFSNGLVLSVLAGLSVLLGMVLLREPFFAFAGVGPETIAYVRPYWGWLQFYPVVVLLNQYLMTMVCVDGDTKTSSRAFAVEFVVNIVVTWMACRSSLGAAGCAIGPVCGQVASLAVLMAHFGMKANTLHFRPCFSLLDSRRVILAEFPASSTVLFTSFVYVFMNTVLVARSGDGALVALAVVSVSNNLMLFLFGIPNAAQPIVGVCREEGNVRGVRLVMGDAVLFAAGLGGGLSLALFAWPWIPAWIVGVDDPNLLAEATYAVRVIAPSYFFFGLGTLLLTYYLYIGRRLASMALSAMQELVFPVLGSAVGLLIGGSAGFWVGYALAPVLALAVFFGWIGLRRRGRFDPLLLPPPDRRITGWDAFVTDETACEIARDVHARLEELGVEMKIAVRGDMLVEDTLMMIKERNPGRRVRAEVTLDCRDGVKLVFRDDGVVVSSFTDSGGGDWFRAQTLGAVIGTTVGRHDATTCGYNRAEFRLV